MSSLFALALLLAAAPDAGPEAKPLTFADVSVGDWLEYELDGKATLKLRACARSATAVTVAISTYTGERSMACNLLLEGVLVEVPIKRLEPPPELPQPDKIVGGRSVGGTMFTECGQWGGFRSFHGWNTTTVRCIAPELVLGGGLVSYDSSIFTIRGHHESYRTSLKKRGNDAAPCPSWPRAPLSGWWEERRSGQEGVRRWTTQLQAGSAWVRSTARESRPAADGGWSAAGKAEPSQRYLADALLDAVRDVPQLGKSCTPTTFTAGGVNIPAVEMVQRDEKGKVTFKTVWAAASGKFPGPVFAALRPLEVTSVVGGAMVVTERLEGLGTGKK